MFPSNWERLLTLGMTRRASAKAWTPSWALPFTLGLCFTKAFARATSTAPAPGTTHPDTHTQMNRGWAQTCTFYLRKNVIPRVCPDQLSTSRRDWNSQSAEEMTRVTVAQTRQTRQPTCAPLAVCCAATTEHISLLMEQTIITGQKPELP